MNKSFIKKLLPHIAAVAFFIGLSFAYFSPVLQNKVLSQHDKKTWKGMAQEVNEFKEETGEISLWTNSMFGGMPTYLINIPRYKNITNKIRPYTYLKLDRPVSFVFLYLIGFYIALLAFKVRPWLAAGGAVAFAFSSYFFIIIAAGHATKAYAIGYMAPIIGGVYMAFKGQKLQGAVLMAFFLAMQILTNHIQIVYYTMLTILIFGIVWLVKAIKEKEIKQFFMPVAYLFGGLILAVGVNATVLYLTYDYGKDSIRGESELSHDKDNKTSGLDKDYATAWSYGIDETLTLLIPNFKGGASMGINPGKEAETYKLLKQSQGTGYAKRVVKQLPFYWGTQPMTSGPVYVGAIICFLFILGLFLIKGPLKWWLAAATALSLILSWGDNLMFVTNFFLEYFPGYNKFRTVSMTLVIAEFTMPLLAILALAKVLKGDVEAEKFKKALYYSFGITGGLALIIGVFSGAFSYQSPHDANMQPILVEALQADREMLLRSDAFRSFFFVLLGAALVWMGYFKKIDKKFIYPIFILLVIIDLWPVNKRYLNNDNFVSKKTAKNELMPTKADQFLLKDTDPNYRVLNLTVSTFNDGLTPYFHKSIGGYHGAKMRRYQELIDFHISQEMQTMIGALQNSKQQSDAVKVISNQDVLNMLNTKYVIVNADGFPVYNPGALGNAWFVENIKWVKNADMEIEALYNINPANTAVIDERFKDVVGSFNTTPDSAASIKLDVYQPNYLKYTSKSPTDQLAVFSEIYYPKGWHVFVDGEEVKHFRANYVLRSMIVPKGEHSIEFHFKPRAYDVGNTISYASSAILILLVLGTIVRWFMVELKEDENQG